MTHSGSEQAARVIAASDDRKLAISTFGPPSGFPVLYHHGTPGSRLCPAPDPGLLDRAGVRLLTFDRSGYGSSSRRLGRSVADAAEDAGLVADAFGVEQFAVLGFSGGGPHALATAALLPGRVLRCATIASVAPLDAPGLDFFAGMSEGNVAEFDTALAGREAVSAALDPVAEAVADDVFAFMASLSSEVGDADAVVLERPDMASMFAASAAEGLRPGAGGWVDDDLAFTAPWGFDVGSISVPVGIWQGTADLLVPLAHGGWLLNAIHRAEGHVLVGAGHFGALDELDAVLRWLSTGSP